MYLTKKIKLKKHIWLYGKVDIIYWSKCYNNYRVTIKMYMMEKMGQASLQGKLYEDIKRKAFERSKLYKKDIEGDITVRRLIGIKLEERK